MKKPHDSPAKCGFPNCPEAHHAKGYCKKHYAMQRRMGSAAFAKLIAEGARGGSQTAKAASRSRARGGGKSSMNKAERLAFIKKRYEIRQKEIEAIRQSLETED